MLPTISVRWKLTRAKSRARQASCQRRVSRLGGSGEQQGILIGPKAGCLTKRIDACNVSGPIEVLGIDRMPERVYQKRYQPSSCQALVTPR